MRKPLLKWLMMGLMCAMFSVAQVSAVETETLTVEEFAAQYTTANPDATLNDLVIALIGEGYEESEIQMGLEAAGYGSNNVTAAIAAAKTSTVRTGPSSGEIPALAPASPPASGGGGGASPN